MKKYILLCMENNDDAKVMFYYITKLKDDTYFLKQLFLNPYMPW